MSQLNAGMFSSDKITWGTPPELFAELNKKYKFTTDVCALPSNAKCKHYFTPKENGLIQKWTGSCYMNPPYGREIGKWIAKAYLSSLDGATVVCLLPARTDTKWFHDYCQKGQVTFIKGRLRFEGATNSAPFPSMIVVFKPNRALILMKKIKKFIKRLYKRCKI